MMKEIPVNFQNDGNIVGKLSKIANPRGLVILVHGFTGSIDGPGGTSWKKLSKELNRAGFDTFRFNFRFTSKGWKNFHKMTISGEVKDLNFVLKKFSKKYKKIAVVGESMGGSIAVLSFSKKIKCLVMWYPATDFRKGNWIKRFKSKRALRELREKGYATTEKRSTNEEIKVGIKFIQERLKIDLDKSFRRISSPILVVFSKEDTIVPPKSIIKTFKLIPSKHKRIFGISGTDHAWWKPGRRERNFGAEETAIKKTVSWIEEWL